MNLSGALDGVSLAAVGAYLAAVFFHGNAGQLFPLLLDSKGYLEFVTAAAVLYGLVKWQGGQPIVGALVAGALFAIVIKIAADHANMGSKLEAFGNGQIGLFDLLKSLFA